MPTTTISTRAFPNDVAVFSDYFIFTTLSSKEVLAHEKVPYEHPTSKKPCSIFSLDDNMRYTSFASDHGPLNLAFTFHACIMIHEKIEKGKEKRRPVCLYTATDPKVKSNMVLIAALFSLIVAKQTPWNAFRPIAHFEVMPFRDAGSGPMDHGLSVQDILYGVEKAISYGLLDLATFDADDYQYHETVENGDLNVLGPFIPFASPVETNWLNSIQNTVSNTNPTATSFSKSKAINHTLRCVLEVFEREDVGLVVRLNDELYDRRHFMDMGMKHVEMYFDDGTNPPDEIVREFIKMAEDTIEKKGKKVAVHCKAGLGRTGVLIGAYLIYKYEFTAQEAIGYMRLVRPGMVVGPQQHYMVLNQMKWAGWAARDQALREITQASSAQITNPLTTPSKEVGTFTPEQGLVDSPLVTRSTPKLRPRTSRSSTTITVTSHRGGDAVGQPRKAKHVDDYQDSEERDGLNVSARIMPTIREPLADTTEAHGNEYDQSSVSSLTSMRGTKRAAGRSSERKPLPRVSLSVPPPTLSRAGSYASLSSECSDQDARPPKKRTSSTKGSPLSKAGLSSPPPSREGSPLVQTAYRARDGQENVERDVKNEVDAMLVDLMEQQATGREMTPVRLKVHKKLRRRVHSDSPSSPALEQGPPASAPGTPTRNALSAALEKEGGLISGTSSLKKTMPAKRSFLPVRQNGTKSSSGRVSPSAHKTIHTPSSPSLSPPSQHLLSLVKSDSAKLKTSTPKRHSSTTKSGNKTGKSKGGLMTPPRITEMWGQLSRIGSSPLGEKDKGGR